MSVEIIALLIAAVINTILSIIIFKSQRNHAGLSYSIIVLFVAIWSIGLAFFLLENNLEYALWFANGYYVAAAGILISFLYFSLNFPNRRILSRLKFFIFFLPMVSLVVSFFINKNFLIQEIFITEQGKNVVLNNVHYFYYVFCFILFIILSYIFLFKSYIFAKDKEERIRLKFVIIGTLVSYLFGMLFNLFFPWIGNYNYIWLGPVFTLIMVIFIGYAVTKHHLFDTKVIATELLTISLLIFILIRTLLAETLKDQIINGSLLVIATVFGFFLIRSVLKEVRAREKIEELATKLEFANLRLKQLDEAKSDFLSIASHQLRTPLTAIKGYASMILEGSYGKISATTKSVMDKIFQSSQRLVLIIGDFLDISHIEQGTMQYDFAPMDAKELVKNLADEFKTTIDNSKDKSKILKISFEADEKENFGVNADRNKIRQVVSNLIDNSIKYTPKGFVKVSLSKISENGNVLLKIEDSGIGISAETMLNLFKKFGRAKSLSSAYANGSGLGLYVAKEIIKAHKGKIWAESEGEGKGSKFFVELPGK